MTRNSVLAAALMATTALTPVKAHALPVIGFIQGFGAALGGSAFLGGTVASAGFGAGLAFGATGFGAFLGQTLISIGLSAISAALTPQPSTPPPSARMANFAQSVAYVEWALGRTRKGGPIGFTGFQDSTDVVTGTTGKKRHYSPILAAHPCHQIVTHYLGEREVEIDGDGLVTTAPMAGFYRIRPFLGADSQVADAELVSAFTEITSAHDFAGLTGAHIWAKRPPQSQFSEIYPTGRQGAYTPVFDGLKAVYDPRDGSTGFTRNAALLMAYWIVNILGRVVDWDEVALEADICDGLVTNAEGGTQPKWRIDGVLSDDQEFEAQRAQMAAACDAWMYERADGSVGFKVGQYSEPTITLTDEDLFSTEISEGQWGRGAPTEIAAQYIEPDNNWRETPTGVMILDATTRQVREEPALFMVSSHNQASRILKRIARVKRAKYQLKATIGLIGYFLQGHRFIRVQTLGIDAVFEIGELWRNEGGLSFDVVANSVTEDDFEFDAATEEPERPSFNSVVNDDDVADVTGFVGAAQDGGSIRYDWDAQDESLTQQIRIREVATSDWTTVQVTEGQDFWVVPGLVDGTSYEAQIRNRTNAARIGDWSSTITVAVVANSTEPDDLDAFTATENAGDVDIDLTAPNDPNYYATRIYRADYSAGYSGPYDIGDASVIRTEYGLPGSADGYTDPSLATGHYAYWGVPINASGIEGDASGPETVDVP